MGSRKFWTEGWGSFAVAIIIALVIRWGLIEAYVIPSASMLPTLLIHDHIFVNKAIYGIRVPFSEKWLVQFKKPERGEVIVFKYPKDPSVSFIKRIVGVPGDKIFYENGKLIINDKVLETEEQATGGEWDNVAKSDFRREDDENSAEQADDKTNYNHFIEHLDNHTHSILLRKDHRFGRSEGPWTVPEGTLFCMGDNRDNSHDSRYWGFMPEENLLGRAMFVWLSCEETLPNLGPIPLSFLCNPLTIRWSRFFHEVK